jgi:signal transduction histidine kinase
MPHVIADVDQLEQVVQNLIANARDAMPDGGALEVTAAAVEASHAERGGPPRRYVRLVVADTGHGIAPEHRQHVFDPFFTTKDPGRGMGLGLAVCYGIVEEHGGWFELESPPGGGTSVVAFLPVDPPPDTVEVPRQS